VTNNVLDDVYGFRRNPYYIYAPRWIDTSAGIKALHYFCHALNRAGENAFLILTEAIHGDTPRVSGLLRTPILTQEIAESHFQAKLTPIVIYSETIPGNPLDANCIVRYLMNYAGILGGPRRFDNQELKIAFSESIAEKYRIENHQEPFVLFIPPIDPRPFNFNEHKSNFQLTYAGKYRAFIGKPPRMGNLRNIEIFRDGSKQQNRPEVINLLHDAKVLYSFENSSIISEAILSGTPTVLVKNVFFEELIAEKELGTAGVTWSDSEKEIEVAKKETIKGRQIYYQRINEFTDRLAEFIDLSQEFSQGFDTKTIKVPNYQHFISQHRLSLAFQILRNQGASVLLRVLYHFLLRRLKFDYWNNIIKSRRKKIS
jgi:hypothetical protein